MGLHTQADRCSGLGKEGNLFGVGAGMGTSEVVS